MPYSIEEEDNVLNIITLNLDIPEPTAGLSDSVYIKATTQYALPKSWITNEQTIELFNHVRNIITKDVTPVLPLVNKLEMLRNKHDNERLKPANELYFEVERDDGFDTFCTLLDPFLYGLGEKRVLFLAISQSFDSDNLTKKMLTEKYRSLLEISGNICDNLEYGIDNCEFGMISGTLKDALKKAIKLYEFYRKDEDLQRIVR